MAGTLRVQRQKWDFVIVPGSNVLDAVFAFTQDSGLWESLLNPAQAVLEVVKHHDRLTVGCLNDIFQGVQLGIVDQLHTLVLVVDGSASHLQQFVRQHGGCLRYHIGIGVFDQQFLLQLLVQIRCLACKPDGYRAVNPLRQFQPILGLHADGDIADCFVNPLLGLLFLLPVVHHMSGPFTRQKVPITVSTDGLTQAFTLIQQIHRRPEVHQAVRGRCTGQAD
ncbi:hypothetical protein D3C75_832080 [compost metagenome]